MSFRQIDFSGGLNVQPDATKAPDNSYPLLINGRVRGNVVSPTNKHVKLDAPVGSYQGLYIVGDFMVLFVSGIAYYANIQQDPIFFKLVDNWAPFSITVPRVFAELVPATSNKFNRAGTPEESIKSFNSSISTFPQALFCFDGVSQPQAIKPDGFGTLLGTYESWTKSNPNYVPKGVLPAWASNKLFLAAPDLHSILHSVSGRASDFVVNLDNSGNKGGEAETVSATVSFNEITAIRAISSGQVLVGTLYGTFALQLDYQHKIFGEPDLLPIFLFPAGPVNELSIVDILQDTAMITQSGIHAFNAVAQAQKESNNFPLGARIKGLITNPETNKALIQSNTCACIYDDFAFFALNTIHGYGAVVYDTIHQNFQSLDLSFGRVKQFAVTKISGSERLFFITHDNQLFEAFASPEKNSTRIYIGEWTPDTADAQLVVSGVDAVFSSIRSAGQAKISLYLDRKLQESTTGQVPLPGYATHLPISIPFPDIKQSAQVGLSCFSARRGWKAGAMIEWNFNGELTDAFITAKEEIGANPSLEVPVFSDTEKFCFWADSGYPENLNPMVNFPEEGFTTIPVTKGLRYVYLANGNGELVDGHDIITEGVFTAHRDTVAIRGSGPMTFALRLAENTLKVLGAIHAEKPKAIIHGGNFAYPSGSEIDVKIAKLPLRIPIYPIAGNVDQSVQSGKFFYNGMGIPRYYYKTFEHVDIFFYNGYTTEPDGAISSSIQAAKLRNWAVNSDKPFKLVICHPPPYTNENSTLPGSQWLRFLNAEWGISAVLSGQSHCMERFVVNGFPYFVCGAGGHSLRDFTTGVEIEYSFRNNTDFGYALIEADALACKISFKDTNGDVLDSYALYA